MTSNKILTEKYNQIVEGDLRRELYIIPPIANIVNGPQHLWRGWNIKLCKSSAEYGAVMTEPFPGREGFRKWLLQGPFSKKKYLTPDNDSYIDVANIGANLADSYYYYYMDAKERPSIEKIENIKYACKRTGAEVQDLHYQYLTYTNTLNKDNPGVASDY